MFIREIKGVRGSVRVAEVAVAMICFVSLVILA